MIVMIILEQLWKIMASLVSGLSDASDLSDKNSIKQEVTADTMICFINQKAYFPGHQIAGRADDFENKDCFTERHYKVMQ